MLERLRSYYGAGSADVSDDFIQMPVNHFTPLSPKNMAEQLVENGVNPQSAPAIGAVDE